jgi:hypothetical protein
MLRIQHQLQSQLLCAVQLYDLPVCCYCCFMFSSTGAVEGLRFEGLVQHCQCSSCWAAAAGVWRVGGVWLAGCGLRLGAGSDEECGSRQGGKSGWGSSSEGTDHASHTELGMRNGTADAFFVIKRAVQGAWLQVDRVGQ